MNGPNTPAKSSRAILLDGLWNDNPVFRQVLGICSTLAVTNQVLNTAVMCVSLTLVTAAACFTVSLLRHHTPRNIRMMVQTLIIASYVIVIDVLLKAYWPAMSRNLGPYVGLIITNCIIMGRCEAFAASNRPLPALLDGLANGLGYSLLLLLIAVVRELLGMGTLAGLSIPGFTDHWDQWVIMIMPPGAFFTLAVTIWVARTLQTRTSQTGKEPIP